MAGSKPKRGRPASGSGKKDKSGHRLSSSKRVSSGGSTHATAQEASPSSVTRRSLPAQYPPGPQDLQINNVASRPVVQTRPVVQNRCPSSSPASHTSNLRRQQPVPRRTIPQPMVLPAPELSDDLSGDEYGAYDDSGDEDEGEDDEAADGGHDNAGPQMTLDELLSMEGRKNFLDSLSPHEGEGLWFTRNEGLLVHTIGNVLKENFKGPWYSWSVTPHHIQDRYFVQFAHRYNWDPILTPQVREHFDEICGRRLKGMINYVKKKGKKPNWIRGKLWLLMCAYWETDEANKRSETASKNSTSDPDGLGVGKHVAGPKSHAAIKRQMSIEEGREVSYGEVFIKTHTRKDGSFVDEKARRVAETYEQRLNSSQTQLEVNHSINSDGASTTPQLTTEQKNALFLESTLVDKRGNPYGLGRLAKRHKKGNQVSDVVNSSKIITLEQKLKEAEDKMAMMAEQNKLAEDKMAMMAEQNKLQLDFVMQQPKQLNPNLPEWQFRPQPTPAAPTPIEPLFNGVIQDQSSDSSSASETST